MKKKIYAKLAVLFTIVTLIGAVYFISDFHERTAGIAGIGLVFMLIFISLYHKEKMS